MTTSITELTGAVNTIISQLRGMETRLKSLEDRQTQAVSVAVEPSQHVELRAPQNEAELRDISRLPDCVKEMQVFDGNPTQYVSWIHSVEGILRDFEIVKSKPIYRAILQHIRGKVRGSADAALVSYNIFDSDWQEIKQCLSLHYADKRDMRTLEHQLNQLAQRNSKLDEFYAAVNHQLSLMVNKLKTESFSEETVRALVETYRNRALDVFIRGLNGDLSRMLIVQKPKTLPEAYSACLEIQNLNYRNHSLHAHTGPNTITAPINQTVKPDSRPSLPHKRFVPNHLNRFGTHPRYTPPRENGPPPRPGPKPSERMEVDRSVQSRQVNYMNRPQGNNPFKRRARSEVYPNKQQRLFNIEVTDEQPEEAYLDAASDAVGDEINFMTDAFPAYHI